VGPSPKRAPWVSGVAFQDSVHVEAKVLHGVWWRKEALEARPRLGEGLERAGLDGEQVVVIEQRRGLALRQGSEAEGAADLAGGDLPELEPPPEVQEGVRHLGPSVVRESGRGQVHLEDPLEAKGGQARRLEPARAMSPEEALSRRIPSQAATTAARTATAVRTQPADRGFRLAGPSATCGC